MTHGTDKYVYITQFQSTHPRRVWLSWHFVSHILTSFNPHTHEGCDPIALISGWPPSRFQSTHPRRVWRKTKSTTNKCTRFQSTHPRRVWLINTLQQRYVSMFQSTHPRRVWQLALSILLLLCSFNPHTHEGCDNTFRKNPYFSYGFNPHTHEGCDVDAFDNAAVCHGFNPHTHEGCDGVLQVVSRLHHGFNPHTHEGCDIKIIISVCLHLVSIHTPTKGVTSWCA